MSVGISIGIDAERPRWMATNMRGCPAGALDPADLRVSSAA
jgi:hypothetical protein